MTMGRIHVPHDDIGVDVWGLLTQFQTVLGTSMYEPKQTSLLVSSGFNNRLETLSSDQVEVDNPLDESE